MSRATKAICILHDVRYHNTRFERRKTEIAGWEHDVLLEPLKTVVREEGMVKSTEKRPMAVTC